jgi:hypothetical protein
LLVLMRWAWTSVLEVPNQDTSALKAKGLEWRTVVRRHALECPVAPDHRHRPEHPEPDRRSVLVETVGMFNCPECSRRCAR